jgi:hypothetical protein
MGNHGPASNPYSACSVPVRGWASPLAVAHVQGDSLVGIAPEASDFEISVSGIERVAQSRRGLGRSLITEHPLVPSLARQPVGFLARLLGALGRSPDRSAINAFARLGAHGP